MESGYFNPIDFRPLGAPIPEAFIGQRIDGYLSTNFPFYSRATWQKRMREGSLLVDGAPVKPSSRLQLGQVISLHHPQMKEPEVDTGIFPIWKKGNVMAVFKPGNLPMHENGPYRKNTFAYLLQETIGSQWAAVHRLDRETSGIVICGANYEVRKDLAVSLQQRSLGKEYLAIAHGSPANDEWCADGPIGDLTSSQIRIKKWVVDGGQEAFTDFQTIARKDGYSLLRARPRTGRTNQIRIHAAYSGHHLAGDITYHPDEHVFLEWFAEGKKTPWVLQQAGYHRCLLHATAISFIHPETGEHCQVQSPMPDDMQQFWDRLPYFAKDR